MQKDNNVWIIGVQIKDADSIYGFAVANQYFKYVGKYNEPATRRAYQHKYDAAFSPSAVPLNY
jgi:hypothetical protein